MRRQKLIITCKHENPSNIIATADGENVCKCGVVLDEKLVQTENTNTETQLTLYHQIENGGDPAELNHINKSIHIHTSDLSNFSNVCAKLAMPDFAQKRAWYMYRKLRAGAAYLGRTKCTAFAIYVACREGGVGINESLVQDAIRSNLCVKSAPAMLSVISELYPVALQIGLDTNEGHSGEYYINLEISSKRRNFKSAQRYETFRDRALEQFDGMEGNEQNKARRAVIFALARVGVKA